MSEQQPSTEQEQPSANSAQAKQRITAVLPYVITAITAVLFSLLLQWLLLPQQAGLVLSPTLAASTSTLASDTPIPTQTVSNEPLPTPTVVPTLSGAEQGVLRLEILDLEESDRQLWSAIYLMRAALQLDDALNALQQNDTEEVERILLAARLSLDRAYAASPEQAKGPIDTFRGQVSQVRDDLRVRPDGADRRLRQIRQLILNLIDED